MTETPQTDSEQQQDIRVDRGDGVVEVTFDRPHRHNAFTRDMYAQMRELCAELAEDRDTRAWRVSREPAADALDGPGSWLRPVLLLVQFAGLAVALVQCAPTRGASRTEGSRR